MKLSLFLKRSFCSLISLHTAWCEGANCLERLGELTGEGVVIIVKVPRSADISSEQKPDCFHVPAYFHCQDFMLILSPPIHLVPLLSIVLLFWKRSLITACLLGWGQGKSTKWGLGCGRCLQGLCYLIGHNGIKRVRPGNLPKNVCLLEAVWMKWDGGRPSTFNN